MFILFSFYVDSILVLLNLDEDERRVFYRVIEHLFDFSDLSKDHLCKKAASSECDNSNFVGILKCEVGGNIIEEAVVNAAKSYMIQLRDHSEKLGGNVIKKLKGIPASCHSQLAVSDFLVPLINTKKTQKSVKFHGIRIGAGRQLMHMYFQKVCLSAFDSKRYLIPDKCDSLAFGHFLIRK